jgi:hypothetical protein
MHRRTRLPPARRSRTRALHSSSTLRLMAQTLGPPRQRPALPQTWRHRQDNNMPAPQQ